jgi:DNA-directed RNA polymerase subunit F
MQNTRWTPLNKPGHNIEECLGGCLEHLTPEQQQEWSLRFLQTMADEYLEDFEKFRQEVERRLIEDQIEEQKISDFLKPTEEIAKATLLEIDAVLSQAPKARSPKWYK